MSKYTNVILFISGMEELQDRIEEVNAFIHNGKKIELIDFNHSIDWDFLPRFSYFGCFNYFEVEIFLKHIENFVNWKYPEYVQILIKEEGYLDCSIYINAGKTLLHQAIKD